MRGDPPFFQGRPADEGLNARFRKPADLKYVYVPPARFPDACASEPAAYVLVTSAEDDRGGRWMEDPNLVSVEQFPPPWAVRLLSKTPTWRFKLVRCASLVRDRQAP